MALAGSLIVLLGFLVTYVATVLGAFIDGVMGPPTKLPPKDRSDGLQVWCRVSFLAYLRDRRDRLRASPARP